MKSHRVKSIKPFLTPDPRIWASVEGQDVPLVPTPLGMQPTEYIRRSWEAKKYGEVSSLHAASVHDGETWAIRASWRGVSPGGTDFRDALAVALPVAGKPALILMGQPDAPIHYLRWAAGKNMVHSVVATGIGQSRPGLQLRSSVQELAEGDIWQVVISRPLGSGKDIAPLAAGRKTGIGFALWRGANEERAGIKAFSVDWVELSLDA